MDNCIFCKIANHTATSKVHYEDDSTIVFENTSPVSSVHLLVIPKKHYESILDVDSAEVLFAMKQSVSKVIEKMNLSSGYKLIFNGGKYQEIMHVHWHLLANGELKSEEEIIKHDKSNS